jgi:hypothetical protein
MRLLFAAILCGTVFGTTFGQDNAGTACDSPFALFAEYNPENETTTIQCLDLAGQVDTLLTNAGAGFLSPNGEYIVYTITNSRGPSLFDYDLSLYVYDITTNTLNQLRDRDGHITANWITPYQLIVSVWENRITTYAAFRPDYRYLYDVQSDEIVELEWPIGDGSRVVGYWSAEDSFLFANYSSGLSQITIDGMLTPIPLPVAVYDSDFVLSANSDFVAYRTKCRDDNVVANCLTIAELGTGVAETITAFSETYQTLGNFVFSPTGRFIAVSLQRSNALGIYDLERKEVAFEVSGTKINGFGWAHNEDRLLVAIADSTSDDANMSFIYGVDPGSGDMELVYQQSVWLVGFF